MTLAEIEIDSLRAFVAVAEAGGFTAAGARLGRTQSAVSVRIRRLEEVLGRRVFARTSRSLALTRDGELLLGYARRMLELHEETVRRFAEPEVAGELRLGVAEYFVPDHLPQVLARFVRVHPRVHIEVRVGLSLDLVPAVEQGSLDLAIAKREEGELRGRPIRREHLCWAAAPGLALPPDQPVPLCLLPAPCVFRARALAGLRAAGRPWRHAYTSQSQMGVIAAARAGLGVTALCASMVPPDLAPLAGFPPLGEIELAVFDAGRGGREPAATLLRFIEDSLRAIPSEPGVRAA